MARKLARRSFLAQIGAAGGALALITGSARAQTTYTGVTDCDLGNPQDAPGYGTGARNQYTDQDAGPNADARCHGRGPNAARDNAPSGPGNYSSGGGYNQQPATGCSDRDPTDPGGRGRHCRPDVPPVRQPCSDRDGGSGADPIGRGRFCTP